jgi:tRNA A37 threonylcarbamoyladenosine synthetase subunit TsaC/SUA5/YrdC
LEKETQIEKSSDKLSPEQEKILKKYWPGKYTFILKSKK